MITTLPSSPLLNRGKRIITSRPMRYAIVLFVPILAGLIFFAKRDIYPFGDNSLLSIDLWGQYFPMYRQLAETDSMSEMMYSWNGGLGFNNVLQSSFYCHSPFLQIFRFLPIDWSIPFINYVCILRLGLAALTCLLLLEYKFERPRPILMAAAISYGLCAYAVAFIMQFMWTDLVVLAPLVLLGVERILDGRSVVWYVVALTLTIYTNFYVAFGVCIFTLLYMLSELAKRTVWQKEGTRLRLVNRTDIKRACVRFVFGSGVAGALNAVTLLPLLMGLSQSSSASTGTVEFETWYHTFADNVNAMLPQTEISLGYGTANIAAGLFLFLLVPLFFFNTDIRFRDKLLSGAVLSVLYVGLNYNPLDYVFNGFHFPNQLPGRWSFVFSLMMILIAANGLAKFRGVQIRSVISAYIVGLFFLFFAEYSELTAEKADRMNTWIGWLTAAALLLILAVYIAKKRDSLGNDTAAVRGKDLLCRVGLGIVSLAVATTMILEVCHNAVTVAAVVNGGVGTSAITPYVHATKVFTTFGELYDCGDDDFYRIENNEGWTFNCGQLGNYKGVSYYGSTMNHRTYKLLQMFGNRVYAQNISSLYNHGSAVQNSLFGVKYIIDKGKNLKPAGLTRVAEYEDCIVWENPTVLPLAYAVSDTAYAFRLPDEEIRGLTTQNALVNALTGEDVNVLEKQDASFSYDNCNLSHSDDWNSNYYHRINGSLPVTFEYRYTCKDNAPILIEHNFRAGTITAHVNDEQFSIDVGAEKFKYIGSYPAGTEVRITVESRDVQTGCFGLDVFRLNPDTWNAVIERFRREGLTVDSFDNTHIEGTITVPEKRLVFTSIPQDGGWEVYVDGEKADTVLLAESLVGFRVNGGTHTVTFRYTVPGLTAGLVISLLTLAIFLLYLWFAGGRHRPPAWWSRLQKRIVKKKQTLSKASSPSEL